MNFSDDLAGLDAAVEDHLCDDGLYYSDLPQGYPGESENGTPVRIMIEYPRAEDRLQGMSFTRSRPSMKARRSRCPLLNIGHHFDHGLRRWRVASAPVADDDGAWWVFEIEPVDTPGGTAP